MIDPHKYTVTYHFGDKTSKTDKPLADKPDMERFTLPAGTAYAIVQAPYPMEHRLLRKQKVAMQELFPEAAFLFTSYYFPEAAILNFDEAKAKLKKDPQHFDERFDALYKSAQDSIIYGNRYINKSEDRTPEDLHYIHVPVLKQLHVFRDNYAVLKSIPPENDGRLWTKINTKTLENGPDA